MGPRIEPEESWLLAPWSRKKTYEKLAILLGLILGVWQTIEWYERGHAVDWLWISLCWFIMAWAYFSQSRSREVAEVAELELSGSRSPQAERRWPDFT